MDLEKRFSNIRVMLKFEDREARKLYGSSDIHLLPSRFEPCGISQMIAMQYGCLPLVRKVGGLLDTVIDYSFNPALSTGFLFDSYRSDDLYQTLERVLRVYTKEPDLWNALLTNAMSSDFSWGNPVKHYADLYTRFSEL